MPGWLMVAARGDKEGREGEGEGGGGQRERGGLCEEGRGTPASQAGLMS